MTRHNDVGGSDVGGGPKKKKSGRIARMVQAASLLSIGCCIGYGFGATYHYGSTLRELDRNQEHSHSRVVPGVVLDDVAHLSTDRFNTLLPIVPRITIPTDTAAAAASNPPFEAFLKFFDTFPDVATNWNQDFPVAGGGGGWIDLNRLPRSAIGELRTIASQIMGRTLACGYPQVESQQQQVTTTMIPETSTDQKFEYCAWDQDLVSLMALNNFSFEKQNWMWVSKSFHELHQTHNDTSRYQQLGYLDLGINIGDGISPIRLLNPSVPIYGIEGSPATAAIAAANLRTSVEYHHHFQRQVAPSRVLPFSLATLSAVQAISSDGGVCFSKVQFVSYLGKDNFGARYIKQGSSTPSSSNTTDLHKQLPCLASDAAGATTLEHALQRLPIAKSPASEQRWPPIYIAKLDIEGYEFKTMTSAIRWLSESPPCYILTEFSKDSPSHIALAEFLLDIIGYDSVWLPYNKDRQFPTNKTPPWWTKSPRASTNGKSNQDLYESLKKEKPKTIEVVLFGFYDVDGQCLSRCHL